jgi:pimeloyl-ACP methyl ester carboxylesterase
MHISHRQHALVQGWRGRLGTLAVAGAVALARIPAHAASTTGPAELPMTCSSTTVPVSITQDGPKTYTLYGELCYRGTLGRTVQLLVHGVTYSHRYWNEPITDGTADYYNYPLAATALGYTTFSVDRIGNGVSSKPPGSELTVDAGAIALHDVITGLRNGTVVPGHAFQKVLWVGHSFGSFHAWDEFALYPHTSGVDGVIITGALHALTSIAFGAASLAWPAQEDPTAATHGWTQLDTTYLTTVPPDQNNGKSAREQLFYDTKDPGSYDPNMVIADENTKDLVTTTQLAWQAIYGQNLPPTQWPSYQITVPVLIIVGQEDALFCQDPSNLQGGGVDCSSSQSVLNFEQPYYPPQAGLQVVVIPHTGHDVQLHYSVGATEGIELQWALRYVGP